MHPNVYATAPTPSAVLARTGAVLEALRHRHDPLRQLVRVLVVFYVCVGWGGWVCRCGGVTLTLTDALMAHKPTSFSSAGVVASARIQRKFCVSCSMREAANADMKYSTSSS